jgi:hypothetical protein
MDDATAKEIAAQLAGVKRQLIHIKWLLVAITVIITLLLWHHSHSYAGMSPGNRPWF